jgi:tetratricopeptide (TPR) repeat protein
MVKPGTENLEAYTLYLRGRYFANKTTADAFRVATEYFEQAIELDPASVAAHCGLAECLTLRGFGEFGDLPPREAMPRAKSAALRAMELDPAAPEPHQWLAGTMMFYDWNWERAEAHFKVATASGHNSSAEALYSVFLGAMSRHRESIPRILRAQTLDPVSVKIHRTVARCYTWAGEYERAVAHLRAALQMEPSHPTTHAWMGRALLAQGLFQEVLAASERAMDAAGRLPIFLELAGCAYAELGMHSEASLILQELRQLATRGYVSATYEANVLGAMGDLDEAFRLYDHAVEQRSGYLALLRVNPQINSRIRSDPRFTALLRQLRLDF